MHCTVAAQRRRRVEVRRGLSVGLIVSGLAAAAGPVSAQSPSDAIVAPKPLSELTDLLTPPAIVDAPVDAPASVPASTAAPAASAAPASSSVPAVAPAASGKFLPPDEAFVLTARAENRNTAVVSWSVAKRYYLYRDRIGFAVKSPAGASGGERAQVTQLSRGVVKDDPYFGRVEVMYDTVTAQVRIEHALDAGQVVELEVAYQGCAEAGLCYPPQKRTVALVVPPE